MQLNRYIKGTKKMKNIKRVEDVLSDEFDGMVIYSPHEKSFYLKKGIAGELIVEAKQVDNKNAYELNYELKVSDKTKRAIQDFFDGLFEKGKL
jgi:hypothetical protein